MTENSEKKSLEKLLPGAKIPGQSPVIKRVRSRRFLSLRWKLLVPLMLFALPLAAFAAFGLSQRVLNGQREFQQTRLTADAQAAATASNTLSLTLRRESDRVALTQGIDGRLAADDVPMLHAILQPLAVSADLDYAFIGAQRGGRLVEVAGVQRRDDVYMETRGAALNDYPLIRPMLAGEVASASGMARAVNLGHIIYTATPIRRDGQVIGVAVVGKTLESFSASLLGGLSHMAVYDPAGTLLSTTARTPDAGLALSADTRAAALQTQAERDVQPTYPLRVVELAGQPTDAAYVPLVVEGRVAGILGLFQTNSRWLTIESNRQLISLAFGGLVVGALALTMAAMSLFLGRLGRLTETVQALATGDSGARTGMSATDEIGVLGKAIDQFASRSRLQQEMLETSLREQRRETAQLSAILTAIPDGVVVQDVQGRIVFMNVTARDLLGQNVPKELMPVIPDKDKLGAVLAPGIRAMGDAQQMVVDGKTLHLQAAAVLAAKGQRIGTVIVVRDHSQDVQREKKRAALIAQMEQKAATPPNEKLNKAVLSRTPEGALREFVEEVNRNAISLQRLIKEVKELSNADADTLRPGIRLVRADALLWNVAREWQPTASAAGININVLVLRHELFVQVDERRLRWAIGNLIDNAIKYTPPGTQNHITLMLRTDEAEKYACFSVQDSGVGISPEDLPKVFTRFYRGRPQTADGRQIEASGTGQGLYIARSVIEAHGGTIRLDSEPGQGTEVTFTLPLATNMGR